MQDFVLEKLLYHRNPVLCIFAKETKYSVMASADLYGVGFYNITQEHNLIIKSAFLDVF